MPADQNCATLSALVPDLMPASEALAQLGRRAEAALGRGPPGFGEAERCALAALKVAAAHLANGGDSDTAARQHALLARLATTRRDYASAETSLVQSLALAPAHTSRWVDLARVRQPRGDPLGAAQALEAALRLSPGAHTTWSMASDVYHELSRSDFAHTRRAIECCRGFLRLRPAEASAWTNLAKVLTESGSHAEAADAARRAVRLGDGFGVRYQLAEALLSGGRHGEAQAEYRALVRRADAAGVGAQRLADAHNHLAVSLVQSAASAADGESDASRAELRRAALDSSRAALRLHPACEYTHAHNYYQVLASVYHAEDEAEAADLRRSIRYLFTHFNGAAAYPVLIFHDYLTPKHVTALRAEVAEVAAADADAGADASAAASRLTFVDLDPSVFSMPTSLPEGLEVPKYVRGYGMGYRHMCRFFCGPLFSHTALSSFEYIWRLDSDSFLLGPPTADPFKQMAAANATYGWVHAYRDEPVFVSGLWDLTASFLRSRNISDENVHRWVPGASTWPQTPMCFATNTFVARRAWFTSPAYLDYFDAVDRAGGFYAHRWGDACVHMLAVAALLPEAAVLRLRSLAYWHQGTVALPAAMREAARELLPAGLPHPVFAE